MRRTSWTDESVCAGRALKPVGGRVRVPLDPRDGGAASYAETEYLFNSLIESRSTESPVAPLVHPPAAQPVTGRVGSRLPEGPGGGLTIGEEIIQEPHRVSDREHAVVVGVACVKAIRLWSAREQVVQEVLRIADIKLSVTVHVAADE